MPRGLRIGSALLMALILQDGRDRNGVDGTFRSTSEGDAIERALKLMRTVIPELKRIAWG